MARMRITLRAKGQPTLPEVIGCQASRASRLARVAPAGVRVEYVGNPI
jgi:hypothetical protein